MNKTWKPKVAGIILITTGVGIPSLALIVTLVYQIFYPPEQYTFFTGPFIVLAIWVLPLSGGIYALRRNKWRLVFTSSITAICYIIPFAVLSVNLISTYEPLYLPMVVLFCLLFLITLLAIPATVFIVMSKNEFE